VAGTTLEQAIAVTKQLNAQRIDVSLDLLGETVEHLEESEVATNAYIEAVRAIAEHVPGATVSVKLSQLGIGLDPAVCTGHLNNLLKEAAKVGVLVEIDMEHSSVGPAELEAFRTVLSEYPDTRVAIQAAMRRTPLDLQSFTDVKPRIRLVKGAFLETRDRALQNKDDITAQYKFLSDWLFEHGSDPAFGTHDTELIHHARRAAAQAGRGPKEFEIQLLYGIRRDLQQELVSRGHRVRVYIPFGSAWYPYLTRRMAERPANLLFFLRAVTGK
jgi:proline dehydrogenase